MSTRSCIAVQHGDTIKAVYCHNDGYISHNGRMLQEHYTSERANYLVALGDMSSLGVKLEPTKDSGHSFNKPETDVCVFYGRDRGETGVGFQTFDNVAEVMETYDACEYFYLMRDDQWLVSVGGDFEPLSDACEYFYLMRDDQWLVSVGGDFEPLSTALTSLEEQE